MQIKSQANGASLRDYAVRFEQADLYDRMFFVWHTGNVTADEELSGITLIGAGAPGAHVLRCRIGVVAARESVLEPTRAFILGLRKIRCP